jgi:ribose transport system ATP-binding protein
MLKMSSAPRLLVDGLSKRFGATAALTQVSLAACAGEVHAVLGENGAGKSTLMKILAGAERADAGSITLDTTSYAPSDPLAARRAGVAMVHQEPLLCPDLSVAENILLGDEPTRFGVIDRRELLARAERALDQVRGERVIDPRARVSTLTVGDRQLVSIARALAGREAAKVIILDEPTSSLSAPEAERLFEVVARLCGGGATVLYISHFLEEVQRVAQRYTVLRDGKSVATGEVKSTPLDEIVRAMAGRTVARTAKSARTAGDVVLSIEGLAGREKPSSATLELRRGEVLGIAGLVGSGRTELLRVIFGLDPVVRGTVRVGVVAGRCSPARRLAQGVGMSSEDRQREGLAQSMSIADNLTLSRLAPLGPLGLVLPSRRRATAARWIEKLAIRCHASEQPVGQLSGGNQQKVALARLLHHGVDVLLLDEPTRGIDIQSREQIYRLIDELVSQGKSVVLVSSQLPELLATCDRIAVMCKGALGTARDARDCDEHALLMEATGAA